MELGEYQKLASRTAIFERNDEHYALMYLGMGLAGETGEVVEKVKKLVRPATISISAEKRADLQKEIGDVLWYLSQLARVLEISLDAAASENIQKLGDRLDRGVLHSEGDNR